MNWANDDLSLYLHPPCGKNAAPLLRNFFGSRRNRWEWREAVGEQASCVLERQRCAPTNC